MNTHTIPRGDSMDNPSDPRLLAFVRDGVFQRPAAPREAPLNAHPVVSTELDYATTWVQQAAPGCGWDSARQIVVLAVRTRVEHTDPTPFQALVLAAWDDLIRHRRAL